jgi:hypothetical protein
VSYKRNMMHNIWRRRVLELPATPCASQRPHAAATAAVAKRHVPPAAACSSNDAQQPQLSFAEVQQRRPRGRPRKVTPADTAEPAAVSATDERSAQTQPPPSAAAADESNPVVEDQPTPPAPLGARKSARRSSSSTSSSSSSASRQQGRLGSKGSIAASIAMALGAVDTSNTVGNSGSSSRDGTAAFGAAACAAPAAVATVAPSPPPGGPPAAVDYTRPADDRSGRQVPVAAAAAAGSIPAKAMWQQELRHFMVSCPTGVQSVGRLCGVRAPGLAAAAAAVCLLRCA